MPLESSYPYKKDEYYYRSSGICSASVGIESPASMRISKYSILDDEIIEYLQRSPLAITLSATDWGDYDPTDDPILECDYNDDVNHGVVLIGYTEDYWIIKNSWGEDWGIDGYAHISRDRGSN